MNSGLIGWLLSYGIVHVYADKQLGPVFLVLQNTTDYGTFANSYTKYILLITKKAQRPL
jgi:hypothetical protein